MRAVGVTIMVLLLFAGIVSSTACEMICTPGNQSAVCCTHTMQSCTSAASVTSERQCGHPQEESALLTGTAQSLQSHVPGNLVSDLVAPTILAFVATSNASPRNSLSRSSFTPPLRI
ncbi:hypothetical protein H7849_12245 [Alloacidobacterium dinghuense]|uniref:Uncharacterized protein n=1 Tax=Alloacidobacterium dinghuense TaxID=2763107 RepID=A0A7G8BPX2_9BACT|nr:hypothetical protein [Alloacidobacterium dinghuense]QNI34592.1 hypothetical protein H7849_12245 [Alloacidobacterium dinghuense]